jgi:gentisate 1,2-dioxygenase
MEGGWHRKQPALWREPRKNLRPAIWRYRDVRPILDAAGSLVSTDFAERRNLTMTNPVEGNLYPTVRTLVAAYQMIRPGEKAAAHRHTPNALRLILEGHGTYTVVDGQRIEMRPGDVLLTPNWAWHSHENVGREDCYWLDFLDVPLVHLMESMFFEHHPDKQEQHVTDIELSPMAFRWGDTLKQLNEASPDATGMSDRQIELGSPALPTIGLYMQHLTTVGATRTMRTTANSIFAAAQGGGRTTIDDESFEWQYGDVFAVPAWRPYRHESQSNSILLRVTDEPLMRNMGFLRTIVE